MSRKSFPFLMLILSIMVFPLCSQAIIYRQLDEHGRVIYSDTPLSGHSTQVDISEASVSTIVPVTQNSEIIGKKNEKTVEVVATEQRAYSTFAIVVPKDQETFQNQPVINVEISLEPKLRNDDFIQLMIDGKPNGRAVATVYPRLTGVERGSHQLSAVIVDKDQRIIQESNSITIYVHRSSAVTSPALRKPAV